MGDTLNDTAGMDTGKTQSEIPERKNENSSKTVKHPISTTSKVAFVNVALMLIAAASLICYVVAANAMAAQTWRFADAQESLSALIEVRNGLIAQQSEFEDRGVLSKLAADAGLVPAGTVTYLVQPPSVAAR